MKGKSQILIIVILLSSSLIITSCTKSVDVPKTADSHNTNTTGGTTGPGPKG